MPSSSRQPQAGHRASILRLCGRSSTLVALALLSACQNTQQAAESVDERRLDLSGFETGLPGWKTRPSDARRTLPLRLAGSDSLWIEARSEDGRPALWRRKVRWSAEDFPILTWTWLLEHPVDSTRFRRRQGPSAALSVDVTLASAFGFHKTLRYVWSARRDKGRVYDERDNWHPRVVVLRDARDTAGIAVRESVDVWNDFRRIWGFQPRHRALSIGVAVHDPDPRRTLTGRFGAVTAHADDEETP